MIVKQGFEVFITVMVVIIAIALGVCIASALLRGMRGIFITIAGECF
jgi:hypothetical protein